MAVLLRKRCEGWDICQIGLSGNGAGLPPACRSLAGFMLVPFNSVVTLFPRPKDKAKAVMDFINKLPKTLRSRVIVMVQ